MWYFYILHDLNFYFNYIYLFTFWGKRLQKNMVFPLDLSFSTYFRAFLVCVCMCFFFRELFWILHFRTYVFSFFIFCLEKKLYMFYELYHTIMNENILFKDWCTCLMYSIIRLFYWFFALLYIKNVEGYAR